MKDNKGRVWAEIDLDACVENYRKIKKIVQGKKIMIAIKADAYGHGAVEIARILEEEGACMFGVADVEEGIDLREKGNIKTDIIVLSPMPYNFTDALFEYNLIPTITEKAFALLLSEKAKKLNKKIKVHVEIDTGMGRTGIDEKNALSFIEEIYNLEGIEIQGVFTHFPSADNDKEFTSQQIERFEKITEKIKKINSGIIIHAANSAGLINFKESHFDMVRPGLSIYGINPNGTENKITLKPVMKLFTRIVNLRNMEKGKTVSYNRTYTLPRNSKIAVLSVGYGDGYPRSLSNKGEVIVNGTRAKIVGVVCMDLTMVDVSHVKNSKIGEKVILIGEEGKERITAKDVAEWAGTIPYEIITRISRRVPRIYIRNGKTIWVRSLLNSGVKI